MTPRIAETSMLRTGLCALLLHCLAAAGPARAIAPGQVLLIYNHLDADSMAVREAYLRSRPGVRELDLSSEEILRRHTITHDRFRESIRFPIRRFLAGEAGLAEKIVCIVLAKGIPHRIEDTDEPLVGDDAPSMRKEWLDAGDFTAASVDSELTLLWQDLERGERGGRFDSKLDGFIVNPYYGSAKPIVGYPRENIRQPKRLIDVAEVGEEANPQRAGWEAASAPLAPQRLGPGDIYLVTRLDGPTRESAIASIGRARSISVDPAEVLVILDANEARNLDKGDYAKTDELLREAGWRALFDRGAHFVTGEEADRPVIAYASYGRNDKDPEMPQEPDYIARFKFAPGAVFNTLESFNGQDFGGAGDPTGRRHTQLGAFIGAGGTFGVGNVWEPFSFTAADNEFLLGGFLARGMGFAEAAYSSLMVLSWQQIVVGDPLARVEIKRTAPGANAGQ